MQGEYDETNEIQLESNQDIENEGLEKTEKVENESDTEGAFGVNDLCTEQGTVDDKNQNDDNNLEFIDKSEMSDEDFKSIKTIDDNINDFEGNKLMRK